MERRTGEMDLSNLNWEKVDSDYLAYQARCQKWAPYGLIRNVFSPSLLFPIITGTLRVLPGWYTDRNGKIEKVAA
jgi:hypothetical protein